MSQLAVVILGCLFGTLAGVIWPFVMLTFLRKDFCNVVNYKLTIMDRADPWIHLFKIAPLVPSIYYVGKVILNFETYLILKPRFTSFFRPQAMMIARIRLPMKHLIISQKLCQVSIRNPSQMLSWKLPPFWC